MIKNFFYIRTFINKITNRRHYLTKLKFIFYKIKKKYLFLSNGINVYRTWREVNGPSFCKFKKN